MKKTSNSILKKYVKRYFVLDLELRSFSYKQALASCKSRYGIDLSLISSVEEHAEKITKPPKGYPNGFIVNTEHHRFVLYSIPQQYNMWVSAFASSLLIKIRPALNISTLSQDPKKIEIKKQDAKVIENKETNSNLDQLPHLNGQDKKLKEDYKDNKKSISQTFDTSTEVLIPQPKDNPAKIDPKIQDTKPINPKPSDAIPLDTSEKSKVTEVAKPINHGVLINPKDSSNISSNSNTGNVLAKIISSKISEVLPNKNAIANEGNKAANFEKEKNDPHKSKITMYHVIKYPDMKKMPFDGKDAKTERKIENKIVKKHTDSKHNSNNSFAEKIPKITKIISDYKTNDEYFESHLHNNNCATKRDVIQPLIVKGDIKDLGIELFSPNDPNRIALTSRIHSKSFGTEKKAKH